ncbi:DUF2262 domain-containing protein [Sphingopyxis sp. H115]|uniref:DUF2262 domain-containing protein n=1 Tax=Sphingopyxis sp. H115 TaxID=1759073 RepID=UPI0007376E09|nr:DUF2262 domain-containing protein [Sphingopyxis sp. H115]KTE17760.1 hypothetical protein ATE71_01260 [Sphingopyxis sp. H115]
MSEGEGFSHEVLGKFAPVADLAGYVEGRGNWCGRNAILILSNDGGTYDQASVNALALLDKDRLWAAEFNDRIYEKLFKTWAENWNEEDGEISRQDWLARIGVSRIEATASGYFTIYYDDGDLFWGHSIEVWGSFERGVLDVKIVG